MPKPPASGCLSSKQPWLWYCEFHDLHGDAPSEEEARAYAKSHVKFANARKRRSTDDNPCRGRIVIHDCREDEDWPYDDEPPPVGTPA